LASISDLVWYVAYGSNMCADRLACYLVGGAPLGGLRSYPGARDPRPPRLDAAVWLPGAVYFATHSSVWDGGRAFYDPDLSGPSAARGWLVTSSQFSDLVAQEMYREPGPDLDLTEVLATGRCQLGPGRYETLLLVGEREGYPLLTFTAPSHAADVPAVAPSAAYLEVLGTGLMAAHDWDTSRTATYLAQLAGAAGSWTPDTVAQLLAAAWDPASGARRPGYLRPKRPGMTDPYRPAPP
jgi:hypothetical protein